MFLHTSLTDFFHLVLFSYIYSVCLCTTHAEGQLALSFEYVGPCDQSSGRQAWWKAPLPAGPAPQSLLLIS